jgi:hypothetical protein
MARPFTYKPEYAKQAQKLCELGATDEDVAKFFEIHRATLYKWINKFEDLAAAMKTGKEVADQRVERSLYQNACGYTIEVEKLFHNRGEVVRADTTEFIKPDTVAQIFWLKNRRPDLWRDVHKHEHGKPGEFANLKAEEQDALLEAVNTELARRAGESVAAPEPKPTKPVSPLH